jgi:hypothetical protein
MQVMHKFVLVLIRQMFLVKSEKNNGKIEKLNKAKNNRGRRLPWYNKKQSEKCYFMLIFFVCTGPGLFCLYRGLVH